MVDDAATDTHKQAIRSTKHNRIRRTTYGFVCVKLFRHASTRRNSKTKIAKILQRRLDARFDVQDLANEIARYIEFTCTSHLSEIFLRLK